METAFLMISAVLVVLHIATCAIASLRLGRRQPAAKHRPSVTLLRPVCGLDAHDERTLGSSFAIDWPEYDVIFCAARADDAAVAVIRRLIAENPRIPAQLLIGEDRITRNPKLNNLAKGWHAAKGDRIVMADANLLLPRDYFERLVAAEAADTGLVSSPPIGTEANGLWGTLEAAFLNGNQARLQLCAAELGQGFAQGKTMMWQRHVLDRAGGIAALGRTLAEDVAATKLVRESGLRVSLTGAPFAQPIGRRGLRAVWARQLRWSKVRRDGFPALFLLEPLNGAALPVALASVGAGPATGLIVAVAVYGAELALCRFARWPVGRLSLPAMVLRDLMLPVLWVVTFTKRGFEWRGTALAPPRQPALGE